MSALTRKAAISLLIVGSLAGNASAGLVLNFVDGSSTSVNYSTSGANNPTYLVNLGSGTATYAGVLSGDGAAIKDGPGTIVLTNANTYTGETGVALGTLEISGSINHPAHDLFVGYLGESTGKLRVVSGGSATADDGYIGYGATSPGEVTVTGANSKLTLVDGLFVGYDGAGTLTIQSNGAVNDVNGRIAEHAGSVSGVTVTGAGSTWTNTGTLYVGNAGNGTLLVQGGGAVTSSGASPIGDKTGSTGSATITGVGSTWTNAGSIFVGNGGNGTLLVQSGGVVTSSGASPIGEKAGSTGSATITGAGSSWTNAGGIFVGSGGNGTLSVQAGGSVGSTVGRVGEGAGITGLATISGTGSTWTMTDNLFVGNGGNGTLVISDGALVSATQVKLGVNSGSTGALTLSATSGNRGALQTSQITKNSGAGTITFDGGVLRFTANQADALSGFSAGNVTINSGGAFLDTSGFDVGASAPFQGVGGLTKRGVGTLTLSGNSSYDGQTSINGGALTLTGTLTTAGVHIGENGFTGALTVTGAGAALTAAGFLTVGDNTGAPTPGGTGVLTIASGGTVTLGSGAKLSIGWTDATGTLNLNGGGTLKVGGADGIQKVPSGTATFNFAGGTLQVVNSSLITSLPMTLSGISFVDTNGFDATFSGILSGSGSLTKSGAGALHLTAANNLTGNTVVNGGGLSIEGGGILTGNIGRVAEANAASSGQVTVTGSGSAWTNTGDLYIGNLGAGSLDVLNGGAVASVGSSRIGDKSTGIGVVTVTGTNSSWINNGQITIGTAGSGTLNIADGGLVRSTLTRLGNVASGAGALTLSGTPSGRGVFETGQVIRDFGAGTLTFDGGILRATASQSDFVAGFAPGSVTINAGGAFIDSNGFNIGIPSILGGGGGLTKQGAGRLTLTGFNTYAGGTTISAGTLQLDGGGGLSGNVANNGAFVVNTSGNLDLGGDISGAGSLAKSGAATLTLSGTNTYSGGTTISGGVLVINSDARLGTGTLTLGSATLRYAAAFDDLRAVALVSAGSIDTNGFDVSIGSVISGIGSLTKAGGGILTLAAANTLSGTTRVNSGGGILLAHELALQSSTLAPDATGGTVSFGALTAATLGGLLGNGALALSNASAAPVALTVGGNNVTTTYSGALTANGSLTKTGIGALTLTGNSTYTGGTTISAGTLRIGSGGTSGSIAGDIVDNATLTFSRSDALTYSGTISGAGIVQKTGAGTLTLTGNNTYAGPTTVSGGLIEFSTLSNLGAGGITLSGGGLRWAEGNTADISPRLTASGSSGATFDTNGNDIAFSNPLTGTGTLTKLGAGTLSLSGNNTFTGLTAANGGTLLLAGGATLTTAGLGVGRLDNSTATVILTGAGTKLTAQGGSPSFLTVGDNPNSVGTLTIADGATVSLAPGAKLSVGWVNATGILNLDTGGTLQAGGADGIQKNAGGTATFNFSGGTIQVVNSALITSLPMTLSNDSTVDTNGLGAVLSGALSGGGALTKAGAGELLLAGDSTYTGVTTVTAGSLRIDGSITGDVSVLAGATLAGGGTIGGNANVAGTLSPGHVNGASLLTIGGDLTLTLTGTAFMELGGTAPADFDAVSIGDDLVYAGALSISLIDGFTPQPGDTFHLFKDFASQSGAFTAIGFSNPAISGNFDYAAGTLTIVAIPEPSTWALLATFSLVFALRCRTQRNPNT